MLEQKDKRQKLWLKRAERSAQYYMNHRWLGGTLTNWQTVSKSIQRLKAISAQMETGFDGLTKKERLGMEREHAKLHASLNGIAEMGGTPDLLFVIDTNKEALAVAEANKLGIPVIGILDTNSAPEGIDYPIPGNDDAARAIGLYCDLIARSALDGMAAQMGSAGVDLGELVDAPVEEVLNIVEAPKEIEEDIPEAVGTKPALFTEAPSEKDDLKKITGVGPKLEEAMNKLGVYQFAQVVSWTNDEIMWIDDSLSVKGRIERDDWVGQVSELIKG